MQQAMLTAAWIGKSELSVHMRPELTEVQAFREKVWSSSISNTWQSTDVWQTRKSIVAVLLATWEIVPNRSLYVTPFFFIPAEAMNWLYNIFILMFFLFRVHSDSWNCIRLDAKTRTNNTENATKGCNVYGIPITTSFDWIQFVSGILLIVLSIRRR